MRNKTPLLSWRNAVRGSLIYAGGDAIACAISGNFQLGRAVGMLFIGGTLYAIEIPAYFGWIDRQFSRNDKGYALKRALCAQAFFNPVWIARHLALIELFSGRLSAINWSLLAIGLESFLVALPIALLINYGIQNMIPLNWRFFASSLFTAGMAVYYALSEVLFG